MLPAAVITFMNAWNSYLWPRVILTDPKAQTMPLLIANLASGYTTDYGLLMMGVLFCSVPTRAISEFSSFFRNSLQKVSQVLSSKKNKKEKRLPFLAAFFYIRNQRGRYNCQGEMGQNDRLSLREFKRSHPCDPFEHSDEMTRIRKSGLTGDVLNFETYICDEQFFCPADPKRSKILVG